jgi:hypothetical protein
MRRRLNERFDSMLIEPGYYSDILIEKMRLNERFNSMRRLI